MRHPGALRRAAPPPAPRLGGDAVRPRWRRPCSRASSGSGGRDATRRGRRTDLALHPWPFRARTATPGPASCRARARPRGPAARPSGHSECRPAGTSDAPPRAGRRSSRRCASPLRGNDRVRHRRARPWFCEATMACSAALESVRTTSFASASATSSRLAKSPSPTRSSTSARHAGMRRRGTRGLAEASGSGTISSMASSFRSGFCDNFSCRSGAPILEPFVQALPVLPSCAPSAIQTR